MMLQHLGHGDAHDAILAAVEDAIREGDRLTPDMGGSASCSDCGDAIAARLAC